MHLLFNMVLNVAERRVEIGERSLGKEHLLLPRGVAEALVCNLTFAQLNVKPRYVTET